MKHARYMACTALLAVLLSGCVTTSTHTRGRAAIPMEGFESGIPGTWAAGANWRTDDNSAGGWYAGWQGASFAWSGEGGEPAVGNLRSPVFTLERQAVSLLLAGWADIRGQTADRWNYVTLNLEDGTEIDRAYAPNTTNFRRIFLNGSEHEGERVYVEVVDDGTEATFSMVCVDSVSQNDLPPFRTLPKVRGHRGPRLENDLYRVEIIRRNGALVRLRDKAAGIELLHEPRLAGNFRFTLPIPGDAAWQATEANYVEGVEQRLDRVEVDGDALTLHWDGPLTSVLGKAYPVSATMRIALEDDFITFGLRIENETDLPIGEVYYPVLGGMRGMARDDGALPTVDPTKTLLQLPAGGGLLAAPIFHTFANQSWLGILGPEQHYGYPDQVSMPWMILHQPGLDRSFYFGAHDPVCRYKVLHLDMQPGIAGARPNGNWPRDDELHGLPLGVRMCLVHMPYEPAGTVFEASPVVVRAFDGGWEEAAAHYGMWFRSKLHVAEGDPAPGLRACNARDARAMASAVADARAAGADAILLTNWREHPDGEGIPWFEVAEELARPIAGLIETAHEAGLRVFLDFQLDAVRPVEAPPTPSRASAAFASVRTPYPDAPVRLVLSRFVSMDPWGVRREEGGWGKGGSYSEGLATFERRGVLNPGVTEYRRILSEQCGRLAAMGADGILVGRFFGPALDFQDGSGTTADRVSWEGGINTLDAMLAAGRRANPGFTVLTRAYFDFLLAATPGAAQTAAEGTPLGEAFRPAED